MRFRASGVFVAVHFLAPLQRAADEIAEPVGPGGEPGPAREAQARYPAIIEGPRADGGITREEEHQLAAKASELGLDPQRALEIREQVEDEASGGDA